MSVRRLDKNQPEDFEFDAETRAELDKWIAKYPPERKASAVTPALWLAQKQNGGWLSEPAIRHIAGILGLSRMAVYENATFYTMFNLSPVGKYFVQLCGTTPCMLCGSDELKEVCERIIGPQNTMTGDGEFSWMEVECLGACVNAPMVQINEDFYEDLTAKSFEKLLDDLGAGREVKPGPQSARVSSEPHNKVTAQGDQGG